MQYGNPWWRSLEFDVKVLFTAYFHSCLVELWVSLPDTLTLSLSAIVRGNINYGCVFCCTQLLQNAPDEVLVMASSTLCNLLLEFSPSKEVHSWRRPGFWNESSLVTRSAVWFTAVLVWYNLTAHTASFSATAESFQNWAGGTCAGKHSRAGRSSEATFPYSKRDEVQVLHLLWEGTQTEVQREAERVGGCGWGSDTVND